MFIDNVGFIPSAKFISSPNADDRDNQDEINLLVIHGISLPPGDFGGESISQLFSNRLPKHEHPYFTEIAHLEVSAHVLIRRDGALIQYVPFTKRAWHAGVSTFEGREKCNDFSIGIELEGTDEIPYTKEQYQQLARLTKSLMAKYPEITPERVAGHCHIAPDRKTDPGPSFDWKYFRGLIKI